MELTSEDIKEFIEIWREEFKEEIGIPEARHRGSQLLELYTVLARPPHIREQSPALTKEVSHTYTKPMEEKQTQKVTLDDLAAMIERNIAHKEDLERHTAHIENFIRDENAKLANMIAKIPTRDELISHTQVMHRLDRIEEQLHLK